jgi:hypothetical protein
VEKLTFGEMAILDGSPRMASAQALEETTLIVVPRQALDSKLNKSDPSLRTVFRVLVQNLRNVHHAYIRRPRRSRDFRRSSRRCSISSTGSPATPTGGAAFCTRRKWWFPGPGRRPQGELTFRSRPAPLVPIGRAGHNLRLVQDPTRTVQGALSETPS